jgi:hypothetical protein
MEKSMHLTHKKQQQQAGINDLACISTRIGTALADNLADQTT